MSAIELKFGGGEKMKAVLAAMAAAASNAKNVRVGFLENASYPAKDGSRLEDAANRLSAAQKQDHPDWDKRLRAWAAWANNNQPMLHVAQVAFWAEYGTKTEPARPYFRNMIAAQSSDWGDSLGNYLKLSEYDAARALGLMGIQVQDDLRESINSWGADNAELTVHIKQFNHGLVDSNLMQRSADYEVQT